MVKATDTLAPLWRAIKNTPLASRDPSHLQCELERIKRRDVTPYIDAEAQHCNRMATAKLALAELPEEWSAKLKEPLTAWRDHECEQAGLWGAAIKKRKRRFFWQCEILRLVQWSGATEAQLKPIYLEAHRFVFGRDVKPDTIRKLIEKYHGWHFKKITKGEIRLPERRLPSPITLD
jgi:hypothetical protein